MSKVKIEHELLESKNATWVALLNKLIKWGEAEGVRNEAMYHFMMAHTIPQPPKDTE